MRLTLQCFEIANNANLTFEQKKAEITARLARDPRGMGTNQQGHVIIGPDLIAQKQLEYQVYEQQEPADDLLINTSDSANGWTVLMCLAQTREVNLVIWLVQAQGANPRVANAFGCTALRAAMEIDDNLEMVRCLLRLGADINQPVKRRAFSNETGGSFPGETALHTAIRYGRLDCVILFLQKGANPERESAGIVTPIQWAKDLRRELVAVAEGGSSRYYGTNTNLIPSLQTIDDIIAILSSPSKRYIRALKPAEGNPAKLMSTQSPTVMKHLLSVVYQATKGLSGDTRDLVNSFLFNSPQNRGISPELVENHLSTLALEVDQEHRVLHYGLRTLGIFQTSSTLSNAYNKNLMEAARHESPEQQEVYDKRYAIVPI